ncbi:hypothetical protein IEQ34_000041 [Dendrobium chrysotoxum]|uniref:SANT domain-containing protein n=1 Tax=Dendrobium chrysotoxum TaxID=161865 RepID=A0AAV7HRT9_DENCH|nr:hypothetical protein IEQ34_000041 [Dendrobium chrysotoxum]
MPSPLPGERKEALVKDRKQDRGAGSDAVGGAGGVGGGSSSTSRGREPYHGQRDLSRASPRRALTGHYRHDGGYQQLYSEESSGHGCTPSRSGDKFLPEEEIFRLSSGRCGGRSTGSGGRESRGSSRRSPSYDSGGDHARQHHVPPVTAQRSVAVPITHASSSSSSPTPLKNLPDKNDGGVIEGVGTGQKYDRDHSLGSIAWKPLKWTRPSSLPLSKTVRSETEEANVEISVPQVKESPARSPVTSQLRLDDKAPSKKARLGWGQGLAKYEKQKVEGFVDVSSNNGSAQSTNSAKYIFSDSSPKIPVLPGSMSPVTPSSITCSSSPAGTDEKLTIKGLNAETDRAQCSDSFGLGPHDSSEDIFIKLDQLDANSINKLALLLSDLMQPEDACSGDSSFTRTPTINKLLLLKKNISKELEKTECEIDLFENRLKSINGDGQRNDFQECTYTSPKDGVAHPSVKSGDASKSLLKLSSDSCVVDSSVVLEGHEAVHTHLSEVHTAAVKDTNDDLQLMRLEQEYPNSCTLQCDASPVNIKDVKPQSLNVKPLMQPAVLLPDDTCSHEQASCMDYRAEKTDDSLLAFIIASNRDAAKRASEELGQAMLPGFPQFNVSESYLLHCRKNYMHVKGRLAMNKRILKFKERVLALKFRALHHLWREDLSLLTMRKHRPKSSKRFEVNSRSSHSASQKHRSSIRSRFALPAGNFTLVPTTEILNFTSKLLLDSQMRLYRDNLKMPAQIIDENDRRYSRFNSNNGLIENPPALEKERVMVNPWMQDEKEVFLEMLATYGKDFKKISSFLSHKTTADCIEFYYKNHKSESFTEVKKHLKWRKQLQSRHCNTYLVTSEARFKRETNATSLELLGEASMIAAESNCNKRNSLKQSGKAGYHDTRVSRRSYGSLEKANSEISGSDREVAAADVLAGICGALSSDAMSSCVTSSIDPSERLHFAAIDCSLTPEAAHTIDEEDTCSDESSDELESADWTDEEKYMFIRAFNMYGKDFVKVSHYVRTRSRDQCKIFYSKARKCLSLDVIQPGSTNGVTPLSDVNGGRSDTDDACAAEIDSAICSTQSCSKMDVDITQSLLETCSDAAQQADADRSCEQCEIVASISDEIEGKFDDKVSVLNEDKLVIERGNLEFGKDQGEICSSGLRSKEHEQVHGAVEFFADTQTNNENTDEVLSPGKPAVKLHCESESNSLTTAEAPQKASCGSSAAKESNKEVDSNQFVGLPDPAVENKANVKIKEIASVGDSFIFGLNSHSNGNSCNDVEQKNDGCPSLLSSNFQQQVPLEFLCSMQKRPQTKVVVPFDEADNKTSIAILNLQNGGDKSRQESVGRDLSQNLLKTSFPNQMDPLHVARSCFIQSFTQNLKESKIDRQLIDDNSILEMPEMADAISQSNCSFVPGLNNDKCVAAGVLNSSPGISLTSRLEHKLERRIAEAKSETHRTKNLQGDRFAESEDQSQRVGDLKLFGQILTHQSSQKSSASPEASIMPLSPRHNSNATTNSSSCWKDAAIFAPRPGKNGLLHHQGDLPQRSYGFWDGNRVQTGLSSLPEPAIVLANYQASLAGMPFNIAKESVAGSIIDYQQQAQLQSASTEKFIETYPELQKRNGFDLLSGFQQQGRIMHLGVNIVAGGGIMVGGNGVSDPVAALQMHYSGRRSKILAGDLDSLMGDTGGR